MERGLIALDVDGTITTQLLSMPVKVANFLKKIDHTQWQVVFVTGRTFNFAQKVLHVIDFPYYIGVQNGAAVLEMPYKDLISKKYLTSDVLPKVEEVCRKYGNDFVVYSGYENEDIVYYRTDYFTSDQLHYMLTRGAAFKEKWVKVESYHDLPIIEFPSVKTFASHEKAALIAHELEKNFNLHAPMIRDPFDHRTYIAQATHPDVTKGLTVNELRQIINPQGIVIAAGDDNNDLMLFEAADIKVAMANSPKELLDKATIVAPPASVDGIIEGLTKAMEMAKDYM